MRGTATGLESRPHEMNESLAPTRDELLDRLRSSGEDVATTLRSIPGAELETGRYESGWNGRQILAHIASMEWTYTRLVDLARQAQNPPTPAPEVIATPASSGAAPTVASRDGILSYNERQVAKRADATVEELLAEFERNRSATIQAVQEADGQLLETEVRSSGGFEGPLAAVIQFTAVDHVLGHLRDIVASPPKE